MKTPIVVRPLPPRAPGQRAEATRRSAGRSMKNGGCVWPAGLGQRDRVDAGLVSACQCVLMHCGGAFVLLVVGCVCVGYIKYTPGMRCD